MSACTQCIYTCALLEKNKDQTGLAPSRTLLSEKFSSDQKYRDKLGFLEQSVGAMYIKSLVESEIDKSIYLLQVHSPGIRR